MTYTGSWLSFFRTFANDITSGWVICIWRGTQRQWSNRVVVWSFGRNYHDSRVMVQMLLKRGVILKTMNQELVLKYTGKATENMLIDG